jgi:hypothetical protein
MSITTNPARHTIVALKLPLSVSALITYARGLVTRMTANPSFPNPTPTLAALARTKGAVATRNDKRAALILLLKQLRDYIQTTADASAENEWQYSTDGGKTWITAPANQRRKGCKVLLWDGTGLCIFQKRLEQGRFASPWRETGEVARMTASELALFIEGCAWVGRRTLSPEAVVPSPFGR